MKVLKLGDSGHEVKELQFLLASHGFTEILPDGQFGAVTQKAVKKFQLSRGLESDGIVGRFTMIELEKAHNVEKPSGKFEFGKAYSPENFKSFVNGTVWTNWKPSVIVIHHTAAPSLAQRPNGFTYQHMLNLKDYYAGLGWKKGPHLFVDTDKIWSFEKLTEPGTHAVSFNKNGIGIECLGNFDLESAQDGRGLDVIKTCVSAVKSLMKSLNLDKTCIRFHRDDPRTTKTCPGKNITKEWFLSLF